jgi:hypothetical protein
MERSKRTHLQRPALRSMSSTPNNGRGITTFARVASWAGIGFTAADPHRLVLGLAALVAACSPTRTINEGVADRGPAVVAAPLPQADRMTVAIGRFTNESTYGSGLFTDESGDRLGKQASDLLSNRLAETQRFVIVERPDIGRLQASYVAHDEAQAWSALEATRAIHIWSFSRRPWCAYPSF